MELLSLLYTLILWKTNKKSELEEANVKYIISVGRDQCDFQIETFFIRGVSLEMSPVKLTQMFRFFKFVKTPKW